MWPAARRSGRSDGGHLGSPAPKDAEQPEPLDRDLPRRDRAGAGDPLPLEALQRRVPGPVGAEPSREGGSWEPGWLKLHTTISSVVVTGGSPKAPPDGGGDRARQRQVKPVIRIWPPQAGASRRAVSKSMAFTRHKDHGNSALGSAELLSRMRPGLCAAHPRRLDQPNWIDQSTAIDVWSRAWMDQPPALAGILRRRASCGWRDTRCAGGCSASWPRSSASPRASSPTTSAGSFRESWCGCAAARPTGATPTTASTWPTVASC